MNGLRLVLTKGYKKVTMTIKELKKLATACRSVGISHYESGDLKFDLLPWEPKAEKKLAKKIELAEKSAMEKIATMSEEDILLYSSQGFDTETEV